MLKKVALLVVLVSLACVCPARADEDGGGSESPWADASTGDKSGNFTMKTDHQQPYIHEEKGRLVQGVYRKAQETAKGAAAAQQTSMGGPLIFFGRNTGIVLNNLAYQTEHRGSLGGRLPETHLDSFVAKSGYNFSIYGDEGTNGPPPLSSFSTIQSGGVKATTGHQSDAPSAWY
jgi:hypothetical protein